MRLLGTLLSSLVALAIAASAVGAFTTGWILVRSLPQKSGTIDVPGLDGPVTIRRDASGFVHVYASTQHDLFLGQGYVHAAERMWQMEVFRRAGSGRLAELFGGSQLDTDRFVRTLGWRLAAEHDLEDASAEVRHVLDAYSEGVNAWLADNRYLSLPFVLTGLLAGKGGGIDGYRPEPWTPVDTVVFAKVQGWVLSGNFSSELFRFLLARKLGLEAVEELYAPYDPRHPTITGQGMTPATAGTGSDGRTPPPGWEALARGGAETAAGLLAVADGLDAVLGAARPRGPGSLGAGSNEWAVGPERSTTGFALLANDPHLGVSMPSIFFVVGLHCRPLNEACPYDVAGVSFPSVPGVILGHNRHIAWGATNSGPDVQDLFVERLAPGDSSHYEYKGELLPFETRRETIEVAGSASVTITVRSTVHGPVIDDVVEPLAPLDQGGGELGDPDGVLALRWTALVGAESNLETFLLLNRARDHREFRAALRDFGGPSQNFLYADDAGHIAFQLAGRIPVRAGGHDGSLPAPGWDGSADWIGYVPFDELPSLLDPPGDAIVTANNAPAGPDYPHFLGREWDPGYRAARITELLAAQERFSPDDFQAMQLDDLLLRAGPLVAAAEDAEPTTEDGAIAQELVSEWDGSTPADSHGAAVGEVLAYRLLRAVFDDELGSGTQKDDLARRFVGSDQASGVLARLLAGAQAGEPPARWWDDVRTMDVVETPAHVIAVALDATGAELRAALGEPEGWTWGRLHRMVYREATYGSSGIPPLEWLLDRGPRPVGGSLDVINDTVWMPADAYPDPYDPDHRPADLFGVFETVIAPAYRAVYDTGDWDAARIIITTGQSEHPLDPHFADLIEPWLAGELVPFPFSDSAVEQATVETLTLSPPGEREGGAP